MTKLLPPLMILALALGLAVFVNADDSGSSPPAFPSHMKATPPPPGPKVHVVGIPQLSPDSGSEMGIGLQFHFGGSAEPTPVPSKKPNLKKNKKRVAN